MNKPTPVQLRANAAAASTKAGTVAGTNPQARQAALKIFEAAMILRGIRLTIGDFKAYLSPSLKTLSDMIARGTPAADLPTDPNTIAVDSAGVATLPKEQA